MKKFISLAMVILLLLTMVGCSKEDNDYVNPQLITFSMTAQELKQYNGKIVQITGYQTLTSNTDEGIEYLTFRPGQIYPETEIDNTTLRNTIPVYVNRIPDYTSRPVTVTGKLVFGEFSDGNGTYSYSYKIENPKITVPPANKMPEELTEYYAIAEKEYPFEMTTLLYTAEAYIYYEVFELDPEIDIKDEINLSVFNEMKKNLKEETGEQQKKLLSLWEKEEALLIKINEKVKEKKHTELAEYETEWAELESEIIEYFMQFQVE